MPTTKWSQIRHDHYEPMLPDVDAEFRELDSKMRLRVAQHKMLVKRRDGLLTSPRPEFLATPEEQLIIERLAQMASQCSATTFLTAATHQASAGRTGVSPAHRIPPALYRIRCQPAQPGRGNGHCYGAARTIRASSPGRYTQLFGLRPTDSTACVLIRPTPSRQIDLLMSRQGRRWKKWPSKNSQRGAASWKILVTTHALRWPTAMTVPRRRRRVRRHSEDSALHADRLCLRQHRCLRHDIGRTE